MLPEAIPNSSEILSRDSVGAFATEAFRAHAAALEFAGAATHFVSMGEFLLRLEFAGPALESRMMPAISHLECDPGNPSFVIGFFDSESTGAAMPRPPWPACHFTRSGEIAGHDTTDLHLSYDLGSGILNLLDHRSRKGLYWLKDSSALPYWENSFPLRLILNWVFKSEPLQPLHAAAVGLAGGGVLIAGAGGSGKTTSALACLNSDLLYAGDDYVLVRAGAEPYVYSLYGTAKLTPDCLVRFPLLAAHAVNLDRLAEEKAVVYVNQAWPHRMSRGFPLRAILVPRVTGRPDSRILPGSPKDALLALGPTTTYQLRGATPATVRKILQISRSLPCYLLEAGTDLAQIPRAILELIQRLR